MEQESLIEQFRLFGISEIEAKIYLHLVNKPPKSILQIAQELDLPRTSVYDNAVKLAEKGLIQKIVQYKSQQIQAYPLSILEEYVEKEKARVEDLQQRLTSLEEKITEAPVAPQKTEVRYYHGSQGLKQMIRNNLRAKGGAVAYSQFGRVGAIGMAFARKQVEELDRRGIKERVITNPRPEALQYLATTPLKEMWVSFRQIRIIDPAKLYISGDTTIYNDIFSVNYWDRGELMGFEVENAELAKTQKSIFERMWAMAEPLDDYLKRT